MAERMRHLAGAALCAVVLVLLATGCTPDPAPTPSPTDFASNEEAFAAAEATYRAYVDAVNQVDLSVPATFEGPALWSTGDLSAADRKSFTASNAEMKTLVGDFEVALVNPISRDAESGIVALAACLDVSKTDVLGSDGISIVTADRAPIIALNVVLEPSRATTSGFAVAETSAREGEPKC